MAEGFFETRRPGRLPGHGKEGGPEGHWSQCPICREILFTPELLRNLKVCRKCGYHFRLTARERIDLLIDEGSFHERDTSLVSVNPLEFEGYPDTLRRYQDNTNLREAAVSGEGMLAEQPV